MKVEFETHYQLFSNMMIGQSTFAEQKLNFQFCCLSGYSPLPHLSQVISKLKTINILLPTMLPAPLTQSKAFIVKIVFQRIFSVILHLASKLTSILGHKMSVERHFSNSNRIVNARVKCCYSVEISSIVRGVVPTTPILGACSRKLPFFRVRKICPKTTHPHQKRKENRLTRTPRRIDVKNVELLLLLKETVIFVLAFQIAVSPYDNRVTIFLLFVILPTSLVAFHRFTVELCSTQFFRFLLCISFELQQLIYEIVFPHSWRNPKLPCFFFARDDSLNMSLDLPRINYFLFASLEWQKQGVQLVCRVDI